MSGMKYRIVSILLFSAIIMNAAPLPVSGNNEKKEKKERINKEQLLPGDKLFVYTPLKPCWMDKYKYFCCPVRKIVRRSSGSSRWIDYCYNYRDELIGTREYSAGRNDRRSNYKSVGGCTLCGSSVMKTKRWKHSYNPKLAPPKKRKK